MSNEQTHPLHAIDKNIIDSLITKDKPEDLDSDGNRAAEFII